MITRIIFTLFIYGVYRCLNLINISYQDVSWDSFLVYLNSGKVTSIAFLDFEPALAGFFVVEVLFMLIPPLRKIRKSGRKGRKVITKWALIASLGFALMEAIPHVKKMGSYVYPDGTAMLSSTSLLAQAAYVSFFVGGFALILFLAKLISKYGVGNGFASLIGLAIIENLCFSLKEYILDIVILGYYIHILGFFKNSTISCNSSLHSSIPATLTKVTLD